MRQFANLIVSLTTAGVLLTSALAVSLAEAPPAPAAPKPAEPAAPIQVKKEANKTTLQTKAVEKAAPKKEQVKEKVEIKARIIARPAMAGAGMAFGAAAAPGEPNPQILQQFRPMLWSEYFLTRSVCELTPEQAKTLARDAEHAFQEAVAKSGLNPQMGIRVRNIRGANGIVRNEPEDSIREGLVAAVKGRLSPEQAAKYQAERDKLVELRKQVMIDNLLVKIDEALFLSTEQRDKIRESLKTNWKEAWSPSPEILLFNPQLFPQIPDPIVVPHLNEAQKSLWRGISKYQMTHMRMFGFMGNMVNGETPEDDTLKEAREAETKARDEARAKREAAEKKQAEEKAKAEKTPTKKAGPVAK